MELKKSLSLTSKIKKIMFHEGKLVDEYGEFIDILAILNQFYGEDQPFDLSASSKTDEIIEYEEQLEL